MATALTQAEALTEAHRLAQATLGAETTAQLLVTWRFLDLRDIDASLEAWIEQASAVISAQYMRSLGLARAYAQSAYKLETGANLAASDLVEVAPLGPDAIRPSLLVTGPGRYRRSVGSGNPPDLAAQRAQVAQARTGQRIAQSGSRELLTKVAPLYRRVTGAKPCAFCAMLASRGAVYRSEATGGFHAHDGCHCTAQPVYSTKNAEPQRTRRWIDVYDDAQTARKSGDIQAGGKNPALNALRTQMRRDGLL